MVLLSNGTNIGPDDNIVLLMGVAGSGKSTFIDIASGKEAIQTTDSLEYKRPRIRTIRISHPDHLDTSPYVLIETPGIDIPEGRYVIQEHLNEMKKKDIKVSGVIYLHPISTERISVSPLDALKYFPKIWDTDNVLLITTMWNSFENAGDRRRQDELAEMLLPEHHINIFENTPLSAWTIIENVVFGEAIHLGKDIHDLGNQLGESPDGFELQDEVSKSTLSSHSALGLIRSEICETRPIPRREPDDSKSDCGDSSVGLGGYVHTILRTLIQIWESIFCKLWDEFRRGDKSQAGKLKSQLDSLGQKIVAELKELEDRRILFGKSLRMISTFCKQEYLSSSIPWGKLSDDELSIIVLGNGGSGKSTLINRLTGSDLKVFQGLPNRPRPVQQGNAINWGNRTVTLIDTTGIDVHPWYVILRDVFCFLNNPLSKKFGGVIYLQPIYPGGKTMIPEPVRQITRALGNIVSLEKLVVVRTWDSGIPPCDERDLEGATIIDYPDFEETSDVGRPQSMVLGPILDVQ